MLICGPSEKHARFVVGRLVVIGVACVLWLAGCATAPTAFREPAAQSAAERSRQNLAVFDKAWALVDEHYFDPKFRGIDWKAQRERHRPEAAAATDDEALYGVINKMAAELKESHLHALSPRRAHEMSSGFRVAAGFSWQMVEGRLVVVRVVPGSPAEEAGIRPGWIVVSRNGVVFTKAPARGGFTARVGESIRFGFLDGQEQPRELVIQPQFVKFEQREARVLADGTLYLRFDAFTTMDSASWISEQLKKHRAVPAVVIDLRQNGGGKMLGLRMTLAEFFARKVPVGKVVKRSGKDGRRYSLAMFPARYNGKIAVLVGPNTASAAEIFSHVLQHEHRAIVVGRKTAGAVVASLFYSLPDGGRLQVPFLDYVGADGQRLEGRGVKPDVEVPLTISNLRAGIDAELEAALVELGRLVAASARP